MKQAFLFQGRVVTRNVPVPTIKNGSVLVQTEYSCISSGTEMSAVKSSGTGIVKRALEKPKKVFAILSIARTRGVKAMLHTITSMRGSNFGKQIGYTAAGIVVESKAKNTVYVKGDRVAVVGTNYANHSEFNCVPENLVIKIPDNVTLDEASTAAIGGIAMQGIRQLAPNVGDSVAVMGLGLIGQLTVQILLANGCKVIGIDINEERLQESKGNYGICVLNGTDSMLVHKVMMLTGGFGVDGAIFTASTTSSKPMSDCFQMLRKKGCFVLVGVSGMMIKREDIYSKELTLKIASSYGPGRYDSCYEEEGHDYSIDYVRFTEKRNIESYFDLIATGKVKLHCFSKQSCAIDDAYSAYERLKQSNPPLLSIIDYSDHTGNQNRENQKWAATVIDSNKPAHAISIAFIGTGSYVKSMHLPNLATLSSKYYLRALMNRSAPAVAALAMQYHVPYYSTNCNELLQDPSIDMVAICTRHDSHSKLIVESLKAGKDVFVEKPPALNEEQLNEVLSAVRATGRSFVVDYNRRFSKYARRIKERISNRRSPVQITYTMNAGFIPYDNWVQTEIGGGRIIGEACHIIDLFIYLIGQNYTEIKVNPIAFSTGFYRAKDNVGVTIVFNDESTATMNYISCGAKTMPKETMKLVCADECFEMNDYMSLKINGKRLRNLDSPQPDKGQLSILESVYECKRKEELYPIPLSELEATSRITFEIERQIRTLQ